jgi:hypothetical protein
LEYDAKWKNFQPSKVAEEFGKLFEGMPDISVWAESDWASFQDSLGRKVTVTFKSDCHLNGF